MSIWTYKTVFFPHDAGGTTVYQVFKDRNFDKAFLTKTEARKYITEREKEGGTKNGL